jgi:hypothetical protein
MLGWWIVIRRRDAGELEFVAKWEASIGGTDWLDKLVADGRAVQLTFDGYPNRFEAMADEVIPLIRNGPPDHEGPLIIGDDYVSIGGWARKFRFYDGEAQKCKPNEQLQIDAWDQS